MKEIIAPPALPSYWIFEDSGKRIHFDAIRGYWLPSTPSRIARVTFGTIEYSGILRGNAQGFPDRDDFAPSRSDPHCIRLAVFGDSFTAAQYLEKNWPDAVEDLAQHLGLCFELLNFSVDGGGLANWWSIVTHIVQFEAYQLNGLIFAVLDGDLQRGFTIVDHQGYQRHMVARMKSWEPSRWPKTLEEARKYLRPTDGYILPRETFEQALQGRWHAERQRRPWRPYATLHIKSQVMSLVRTAPGYLVRSVWGLYPAQVKLIEQIDRFAQTKSLPVIVVRVPLRDGLIQGWSPPKDVLRFTSLLHATFIDGSAAFAGLSAPDIRAHWLPYDGHWAQSGSDRFAAFMLDILCSWPQNFLPTTDKPDFDS
jgi:hypothetical protein